jgi:hypothetical protein
MIFWRKIVFFHTKYPKKVVATPVQTKNVLIKPNSTELKRAPLKKKGKITEVKNSALYNAEGQILLFSSDIEIFEKKSRLRLL